MNKLLLRNTLTVAFALLFLPLLVLPMQSGNVTKSFTGEVTDSICAPSGSHAATMARMPSMGRDSETCTKQCVAVGAKYMLYDEASHTAYSVDNQDKLARFAGHKVRITGSLSGSTINVAEVNELS